ncbi:MAG: xanthine permease XanP, partial [Psychrobacter glaciei]
PDALKEMPKTIQNIFGSAITTSGLSALILNLCLPKEMGASEAAPLITDEK